MSNDKCFVCMHVSISCKKGKKRFPLSFSSSDSICCQDPLPFPLACQLTFFLFANQFYIFDLEVFDKFSHRLRLRVAIVIKMFEEIDKLVLLHRYPLFLRSYRNPFLKENPLFDIFNPEHLVMQATRYMSSLPSFNASCH